MPNTVGYIHSLQSLGAVDGPGLRFVAFLAGCPLRCDCCHNPDAWEPGQGQVMTASELAAEAARYRLYFGTEGGITLSGGEPLLQAAFAAAVFGLCRKVGIHTCLDTSGCLWNREVAALLTVTDRVLLDIKYTDEASYRDHVGCSLAAPLRFLGELETRGIPTTLRQVTIPGLSDDENNVRRLAAIADAHSCVDGVELLPFRKICAIKYNALSLPFPLANTPEPTPQAMSHLTALLKNEG